MKKAGSLESNACAIVVSVLVLSAGRLVQADFVFGEPTPASNINLADVSYPQISRSGLELYFQTEEPGQNSDIWIMRRSSLQAAWHAPVRLDLPGSSAWPETSPCISPNGLELYFADPVYNGSIGTPRSDGYGSGDIWVSKRTSVEEPWGDPENLGAAINRSGMEDAPALSADGLSLYFMSWRTGGQGYFDLYVSTRAGLNDPWGPAENVGSPINSAKHESAPFLSADGLSLFFSAGAHSMPFISNIYVSRRQSLLDSWESPTLLGPVQMPGLEFGLSFAEGDSSVYFSNRPEFYGGDGTLWRVEVAPIVDLNEDNRVDSLDVQALLNHWGSTESLYDIAPAPIGDGKVDAQDLALLVEYLEPADADLIAHWRLDEAGWDIAYDSAGRHGGILEGGPTWRPEEGISNGALQFDGIDDYMRTPFVLDPAAGPFSICVWIQGGAPGQVIISQVDHSDWLLFGDQANLMTDLVNGGRRPSPPLASEGMHTDGIWHHVVLVSDGLRRYLYMDGRELAWDSTPSDLSSNGGLHIGAGNALGEGSFFTGLVDDVRVYTRALRANEIAELAR